MFSSAFMRGIQVVSGITLIVSACKMSSDRSSPKPEISTQSSSVEKNANGSPLLRREVKNGDSQGDLKSPNIEHFQTSGVPLFPPEANGEYEIGCVDKIAGANLAGTETPLNIPVDGTPYTIKTYIWIEDSRFAMTRVAYTGARCGDTQATSTFISTSQFIVFCNVTKSNDGSIKCTTKHAIYTPLDDNESTELNRMHFCGYSSWQDAKTYDVTGRSCNQQYTDIFEDGSTIRLAMALESTKPGDLIALPILEWDPTLKQIHYYTPGRTLGEATSKFTAGDGRRSVHFTSLNAIYTTPR